MFGEVPADLNAGISRRPFRNLAELSPGMREPRLVTGGSLVHERLPIRLFENPR